MGDDLAIKDVAERTGIAAGTLRMWEQRYGFPEPRRLPSGHRRYDEDQVDLIKQVARDRESGLSMPAAIERARRLAAAPEESIFAGLRRRQRLGRWRGFGRPRRIGDRCAIGSSVGRRTSPCYAPRTAGWTSGAG